ncbi:DUF4145 domain-containing protein [Paenibacillus kribbensis]|uniref:DUF4145 domain-containing protein n=1 Tax=Paenibacillus kribbensis TaxID=172713 RepID=UPI0015C19E7B|nr:DUF4145 domain-containing protein [Paenibacillus kribbensis]
MSLSLYSKKIDLARKTEIDKVTYLSYYFHESEQKTFFYLADILGWFDDLNFVRPNISRLKTNLKKSRNFVKGKQVDSFMLHPNKYSDLKLELSFLIMEDEEVKTGSNEVIPNDFFQDTRGYIKKISKQINSSYENNIFDGCAVLMRRLLEILLIHSFENLKLDGLIRNKNNDYLMLSEIIDEAKKNSLLNLSRNTKEHLDYFRKLGNFAAHKIYYNTKKQDIEKILLDYRSAIEELLYKSGIKK